MPNLTFEERDHCYRLDGVRLPSVTEILSAVVSTAVYASGAYRLKGQRVHEACALFDQGELDNYELGEEIQGYVESYKRMYEVYQFDWTHIEHRSFDAQLLVAGTVDRAGWMSGPGRPFVVLDIKSGGEEREAALQTAAYARMVFSGHRKMWQEIQRFRVSLDAKGGPPKIDRFDDPFDFQAWEGAVALYKWQMKKAKVFRAA